MKSQSSIVARNYRLQEWANMIQECNNRPVGMSVNEWCENNSITKANYYYRLTQVRKACLDTFVNDATEQAVVPIPVQVMSSETYPIHEELNREDGSYVEVSFHGCTLRINENTSSALITKIFGALTHVE